MAIKANKGGNKGNFVQQANIEPGSYPARVVQLIDYGVQPQRAYQGAEKPPARELGVTYELLDEFMKDENGNDIEDKPRWVSETFPIHSLNSELAKSTKRIRVFDPTDEWEGDFTQMVDKPVLVTIVNNKSGDRVYDNVATISAMRPKDAANAPALKNATAVFDLDEPNMAVFNKFPEWIQTKIKSNLEYQGSALQKLAEGQPKVDRAEKKVEKPVVEDDNCPY